MYLKNNFFYKFYLKRQAPVFYLVYHTDIDYILVYNNIIKPLTTNRYYKKFLYYKLSLFVGSTVKSFRNLMGYPARGQRTWSNGKNSKKLNSFIFNLKYLKFRRLNKSFNIGKNIVFAEYVNLFFQQQWFIEWFSSAKKIRFLPNFIKNKNFIDINSINSFYIYSFYKNPFIKIKKRNRRKRVKPGKKVATGLFFGFSFCFKKQLQYYKK